MIDQDIEELTDWQHARLKTEIYFGSRDPHNQVVVEYENGRPVLRETTWTPAVFTAIREIIDNALDEVVGFGQGNTISIRYDCANLVVAVEDNGRGIPIGTDEKGRHKATVALSRSRAGRNFGEREQVRGTNGVGASAVNFCSEWFNVDIWRERRHFAQCFHEGDGSNIDLVYHEPLIVPVAAKDKRRGTRIEFKLSRKVFRDALLPESFVRARVYEAALCYPKLRVFYNGEPIKLREAAEKHLFGDRAFVGFDIGEGRFSSRFWLVPEFLDEGEHVHSLVNGIPAFDGGVHIDAFRRAFYSGLLGALERESKRRKLVPHRSDISERMLLYNITQMDAPNFNSQAKTRLSNEHAGHVVRRTLDDPEFFKTVIKQHPEWIESIYRRCEARTMRKDASDATKQARRNLRNKIPDLEDATGHDRRNCILFLGEGRSAIAGMVEARVADLHGGLPLRGKVLNVFDQPLKKVLANEALANVMGAIGLVPGQRANRHALRYGKVYLATDADEDGKNIAALLVNFFYTLWPELFDPALPPFVHVFLTPLIIAAKGKQRKYWYDGDADKFDADAHKGWEVTRAKGLAALKKVDWQYALGHPKVMPIVDDGRLSDALNLIFNPERAADRRDWIGL